MRHRDHRPRLTPRRASDARPSPAPTGGGSAPAKPSVAAVNALHDRETGGYDPRTEVEAHAGGDVEQLIAAWEHDQVRRIKYAEHRVRLARQAEANKWEHRLQEELEARDAERNELAKLKR